MRINEKNKKTSQRLFIIIAAMIGVAAFVINWAFFDIQRISGQEYFAKSTLPKKTHTVTAYLNNGGATTSYAVLGTLKNNKIDKIKDIYWQYRCEKGEKELLNAETIKINGLELNVKNEIYDYRGK